MLNTRICLPFVFGGIAMLLSSCGSESDVEAQLIWESSNGEIHQLHVESIIDPIGPIPETYLYDCPDGGSVSMIVRFRGDPVDNDVQDLLHLMDSCVVGDLTFSGQLDYFDVKFCENGAPSFVTVGNLTISGAVEDDCEMAGTEVCGLVTKATVCGRDAL